jgi:hypothetical protein
MKNHLLFYLLFFSTFFWARETMAQDEELDSLLNYYLRSDSLLLNELEAELAGDSITIFDLIDSLMATDYRFSQLSLRVGYTSNITNAGRNFGLQQYGFSTGITYYNKTGLFGDLSGFWNSEISPHYNPTITTLGYIGNINPKWNYSLSYDHFFYHHAQTDENGYELYFPLTNSLNASSYYDISLLTIGTDYSYLFGQESAHRIRGYLSLNLRTKKKIGFIDRMVFLPTASILLGNQKIYYMSENYRYSYEESLKIVRNMIGRTNFSRLWRNKREILFMMADEVMKDNVILQEDSENVFGIMNYSLSAPIFLYMGKFSVTLSYHLNIPVALPGEDLNLDPNSYFGCSVMYNIPFIK